MLMKRWIWGCGLSVALLVAGCETKPANTDSGTGPGAGTGTAPEASPAATPGATDVALSGEITVDGSSTVAPITSLIAEEFGDKHAGVRVPVGISGTSGGFKQFVRGELDICDASRPISESEMETLKKNNIEWLELQVAIDGLTVCINPKNDWCQAMTIAQLKKLWAPDSTVKKWNEIDPSWPDREIKLFGADTDSGTFEYFTEAVVGKKNSSRPDYQQNTEDNVLVQGVAQDEAALGYFGYTYYVTNQDKVQGLPISNTENPADAVAPELESIRSGKYAPLSRPLFIYVSKKSLERPAVAEFLRFYLSDEGQKLVAEAKAVQMSGDQLKAAREKLEESLKK
ncbi:MAG: PstS family phosphate ABC transporter substrate-binding protein [Planctomycetota bacterium]|nr:MAG: PstS family phosphate ABC transporter substrate-binding protein [Planctomycetota bacterium]